MRCIEFMKATIPVTRALLIKNDIAHRECFIGKLSKRKIQSLVEPDNIVVNVKYVGYRCELNPEEDLADQFIESVKTKIANLEE